MNKWDLSERKPGAHRPSCARRPTSWLPQVKGVPVVAVSGLTGEGLDRLMQAVVEAHEVWNKPRRRPTRSTAGSPTCTARASAAGGVGPAHPA